MNKDQAVVLATGVCKFAAGALTAHGLTADANLVNSQDTIGLIAYLILAGISHWYNKSSPPAPTSSGNFANPSNISGISKTIGVAAVAGLVLIGSGCATDPHQVVVDTSGDGVLAKAAVPAGSFGSLGLSLFIGRFKQTDVIQPTSTNKVYAPNVSVVAEGRGKGNVNGASGTNATATVTGGSWDVSSLFTGAYIGSSTSGTNGSVTIDQK